MRYLGRYKDSNGELIGISARTLRWLDSLMAIDKDWDMFTEIRLNAAIERNLAIDMKIKSVFDNLEIL